MTSSPELGRRSTPCLRRCRRCGACASSATGTSRALIVAAFSLALLAGAARCAARATGSSCSARACCRATGLASASRLLALGRVGHRDLVPRHGQHARAAPIPRQGHDRARVARRDASGVDRDDRASGASRVSRSPRRCCATRCSCSTTCTCRCSRRVGGSCGSASPSRC